MSVDKRVGVFPPEYQERAAGVLSTLQSFFMTMPRGGSFCSRDDFEKGFAAFAKHTDDARLVDAQRVLAAIEEDPRAWLVLRCILGFTPPEAAYVAVLEADESGDRTAVGQTQVRDLDARARRGEKLIWDEPARRKVERDHDAVLRVLVPLLVAALTREHPKVESHLIHRLDKIDTHAGSTSLADIFKHGVPYSELLYERLLGRPYASHRDSVSGIVGDYIEGPLAQLLDDYGIDGAMARPREKVPGFDQAPDCRVPRIAPKVIIEAKLTEDDGTARDKVSRVLRLRALEDAKPADIRCQVVAVVDGRGFMQRMEDMLLLMRATDGRVYTLAELEMLVAPGGPLEPFITRHPERAKPLP